MKSVLFHNRGTSTLVQRISDEDAPCRIGYRDYSVANNLNPFGARRISLEPVEISFQFLLQCIHRTVGYSVIFFRVIWKTFEGTRR